MCGIAGAFAIDGLCGPPLDRPVLERMTAIIRHRGPDDDGFVHGPGMSLGARRLSIIDVEGGHQPLSDERGHVWAAQNGEIYNHVELRNELRAEGHVFRSRCDTRCFPICMSATVRRSVSACMASSPWRSGMLANSAASWRATAWASSRSTTRRSTTLWSSAQS